MNVNVLQSFQGRGRRRVDAAGRGRSEGWTMNTVKRLARDFLAYLGRTLDRMAALVLFVFFGWMAAVWPRWCSA